MSPCSTRPTSIPPTRRSRRFEAIAWDKGGQLLAAGELAALTQRYPRAKRISLPQATVLPGLIDAHGHVMGLG